MVIPCEVAAEIEAGPSDDAARLWLGREGEPLWSDRRDEFGSSIARSRGACIRVRQLPDDALRDELLDLCMARNRLGHFRQRILIPIVLSAVSDENGAAFLDLPNQIASLHATSRTE